MASIQLATHRSFVELIRNPDSWLVARAKAHVRVDASPVRTSSTRLDRGACHGMRLPTLRRAGLRSGLRLHSATTHTERRLSSSEGTHDRRSMRVTQVYAEAHVTRLMIPIKFAGEPRSVISP